MRFRLLRGTHVHGSVEGKGGKKQPIKYRRGDVVESDVDLVRTQGVARFERVPDDTPLSKGSVGSPVPDPKPEATAGEDVLEDMTVQELRKFAEDSEVDLGAARTKAEIIAVIRDTV